MSEEIKELTERIRTKMITNSSVLYVLNTIVGKYCAVSIDKENHCYCVTLENNVLSFYVEQTRKFTIDFESDIDEAYRAWSHIFENLNNRDND